MIKLNLNTKDFRFYPNLTAGLLSAALLGGLLLGGCSEHEDMNITGAKALSITASLEQAQTRNADDPTTLLSSGSLGVFLSDGNNYDARKNVKYTYAEGSWDSHAPIYLGADAATLCAYYPYDGNVTDAASVSLSSGVYAAENDLCYATNQSDLDMASPTWTMLLKHAYSQVTVRITRDASYVGACSIGNVVLTGAGLNASASLNIGTGVYSNATGGASLSAAAGVNALSGSNSASVSFLMVPTSELSGELTAGVLVDGHTMLVDIDAASTGLSALNAGVNYTLNLEIRGTGLVLSGISLNNWHSVDAGSYGTDYIAPEANCYIVAPGGSVNIPVSRANASDLGTQLADVSKGWSSEVIWRDNSSLEMSSDDALQTYGAFTVKATDASATGNALVAIKDGEGKILWSWHIWVTDYNPNTENQSFAGTDGVTYTFMDRNLGAVNDTPGNAGALGLMYQWGRKDPFAGGNEFNTSALKTLYSGRTGTDVYNKTPSAPFANTEAAPTDADNNLENSVRHPGLFYFNSSSPNDWYLGNSTTQNDDLWKSTKTVYDPCPTGWKIAPGEAFSSFSTTTFVRKGTTSDDWKDYPGRFLDNETTGSWFPASGDRDSDVGGLYDVGMKGYYWSSTIDNIRSGVLFFYNGDTSPAGNSYRAYGFALRCVQD